MYRVYIRNKHTKKVIESKWYLLAAFVYSEDALTYTRDKLNDLTQFEDHTIDYKIMHKGKNFKVFNHND